MKRILLSMMTLGAISMMAQSSSEYVPLVREGVKWDCAIIQYRPDDTMSEYPYTIEFRGDTTINEKTYKKCYYFFDGHTQEECDSTLRAFVREDIATRQVWALNNPGYISNDDALPYWSTCFFLGDDMYNTQEVLIYDFSNPVSDNILYKSRWSNIYSNSNFNVATDTIEVEGKPAIVYSVSALELSEISTMYLIESVGFVDLEPGYCSGDLLNPLSEDMIPDMSTWDAQFYRLRNADGEVIYSAPADPENEYVQLLNETQTWEGAIIDDNGWTDEIVIFPYTMKIKGDTIINGRIYKKCYYYWYNDTTIEDNTSLRAFLRENHCMRAVFAVPNYEFSAPSDTINWCTANWMYNIQQCSENGEAVLYSFNDITAPETYSIGRYYEGATDNIAIDKVTIDNIERKRYISTFISGLTVIEGLGYVGYQNDTWGDCSACDFLEPNPPFVAGGHDRYSRLYRVKNAAGEVIYRTNYDKDNSVSSIIADESIATIDIYNIQGVLLMQGVAPAAVNNLDAGLYIVKSYNAAGDSVKTSKVIIGNSINSTN